MIKSAGILLFASVMLLLLVIPFSGEASQLGFPDSDGQLVRIGVLAKRGSEECLQNWGPTADYLSRKIENFRFQIVPLAFKEVVPSVQAKEVDFVIGKFLDLRGTPDSFRGCPYSDYERPRR